MNVLELFEYKKLAIGDKYKGGKVAYIDESGKHGLIAANSDQSEKIIWINYLKFYVGATGSDLGTGRANTDKIYNNTGFRSNTYAAGIARSFKGGGYSDWYLPSKEELNLLYLNRALIGGFQSAFYWSSTECDENTAWLQFFNNGMQFNYVKNGTYHVRAVRIF